MWGGYPLVSTLGIDGWNPRFLPPKNQIFIMCSEDQKNFLPQRPSCLFTICSKFLTILQSCLCVLHRANTIILYDGKYQNFCENPFRFSTMKETLVVAEDKQMHCEPRHEGQSRMKSGVSDKHFASLRADNGVLAIHYPLQHCKQRNAAITAPRRCQGCSASVAR